MSGGHYGQSEIEGDAGRLLSRIDDIARQFPGNALVCSILSIGAAPF